MKKKFRIYDRVNERMIYSSTPREQDRKREYIPIEFGIGFSFNPKDLSEPMMDTGLKDKNGKQIWEDDLTMTEHGLMKVFFLEGRFMLVWEDNGTHYEDLHDINRKIEIIGNPHEYTITTNHTLKKKKKS